MSCFFFFSFYLPFLPSPDVLFFLLEGFQTVFVVPDIDSVFLERNGCKTSLVRKCDLATTSLLEMVFILACYVHYHLDLLSRPRIFCRYLVRNVFLMCPVYLFLCILFLAKFLDIITSFA